MNAEKLIECESRSLQKILNIRLLPNLFKQLGLGLAIAAFLSIIALKLSGAEMETLRFILRNVLLAGLLLTAVSRDKFEDEMSLRLRQQANTLALIFGAGMAILQPFLNFAVDNFRAEEATLVDAGAISTVLLMLLIHLCYFEMFKRMR